MININKHENIRRVVPNILRSSYYAFVGWRHSQKTRYLIQKAQDIMDYIITSMMPHLFEEDFVSIQNGQWTEEVSLQVSSITQCPAIQLCLYNNLRATIVQEISHIHFTVLTEVQLTGNRIKSVEGLVRVHMAHIKYVFLRKNNITSVGVIRKAVWPDLTWLGINNNHFGDGKSLVHGYFPQLKGLWLYERSRDKNKFTEHCFPAKMQAASLNQLHIRENKFCFGRSLKRPLKQRQSHVRIK